MSREWVALNAIKGLGPVKIQQLLKLYKAPAGIFEQSRQSLSQRAGLSRLVIDSIKNEETFSFAEKQVAKAASLGVRILTLDSDNYPPLLKQIFAPPPVLYVKGNLSAFDRHAVGVVGTRSFTHYGEHATAAIVRKLSERGIAIVSGLARGIDTVAHRTCLDNGGATIAVLGCGVDRVYPSENKDLAGRILENGALLSEFPLATRPEAFNFPRRNRIISGLAAGVVVVEAGKKSGAQITARYALQQGRDVFAVPGSIFSDKSDGTFNLIKSGATPVRDAQDIIESIEVIKHRSAIDHVPKATQPPLDLLSEAERLVLEQLTDEPQRIDQIIERTEKLFSELFNVLLNLELKGMVKQVAGQQYVRM
jgi:DNA processing protein